MSSIKISLHVDSSNGISSGLGYSSNQNGTYTVPTGKKFTGKAVLWSRATGTTSSGATPYASASIGSFVIDSYGVDVSSTASVAVDMSCVEVPIELTAGESITGAVSCFNISQNSRRASASLILTGIES